MKKTVIGLMFMMIWFSSAFSGCQDTNSVKTTERPKNVYLDSTIVELANVSYEKNTKKSGEIESVTVGWLLHNIAGKQISAKIDVKFYDRENIFLYNASKFIRNMPAGYTEQSFQFSNKVTFEGAGAEYVNHVVISVTEL